MASSGKSPDFLGKIQFSNQSCSPIRFAPPFYCMEAPERAKSRIRLGDHIAKYVPPQPDTKSRFYC